MFNYLLKNIPAQYAFGGYAVRKSTSIVSTDVDGELLFDIFTYTYIDKQMTMFILMEDGTYKSVEYDKKVPALDAAGIMSKHLYRGKEYNKEDYPLYDKEEICGVFGLRDMLKLMEEADAYASKIGSSDMRLQAIYDIKKSYTGMEIMGAIGKFNQINKWGKGLITVPPIKYDETDSFNSVIGDELDFFDIFSNRSIDECVKEIKRLDDLTDGIGNIKEVDSPEIL